MLEVPNVLCKAPNSQNPDTQRCTRRAGSTIGVPVPASSGAARPASLTRRRPGRPRARRRAWHRGAGATGRPDARPVRFRRPLREPPVRSGWRTCTQPAGSGRARTCTVSSMVGVHAIAGRVEGVGGKASAAHSSAMCRRFMVAQPNQPASAPARCAGPEELPSSGCSRSSTFPMKRREGAGRLHRQAVAGIGHGGGARSTTSGPPAPVAPEGPDAAQQGAPGGQQGGGARAEAPPCLMTSSGCHLTRPARREVVRGDGHRVGAAQRGASARARMASRYPPFALAAMSARGRSHRTRQRVHPRRRSVARWSSATAVEVRTARTDYLDACHCPAPRNTQSIVSPGRPAAGPENGPAGARWSCPRAPHRMASGGGRRALPQGNSHGRRAQ